MWSEEEKKIVQRLPTYWHGVETSMKGRVFGQPLDMVENDKGREVNLEPIFWEVQRNLSLEPLQEFLLERLEDLCNDDLV